MKSASSPWCMSGAYSIKLLYTSNFNGFLKRKVKRNRVLRTKHHRKIFANNVSKLAFLSGRINLPMV